MERIADIFSEWLKQIGLSEDSTYIVVILVIFLLAFLIDRICRRLIIPLIHKITARTDFFWDDYLLNDKVLNDFSMLLAPLVVYVLLPIAIPHARYISLSY